MSQQSFSASHKLVSFGRIAAKTILTTTAFSALVYFSPALGDRAIASEVEREDVVIEDVLSSESYSTSAADLCNENQPCVRRPSIGGELPTPDPNPVFPSWAWPGVSDNTSASSTSGQIDIRVLPQLEGGASTSASSDSIKIEILRIGF